MAQVIKGENDNKNYIAMYIIEVAYLIVLKSYVCYAATQASSYGACNHFILLSRAPNLIWVY